jgi:hypothetical protein
MESIRNIVLVGVLSETQVIPLPANKLRIVWVVRRVVQYNSAEFLSKYRDYSSENRIFQDEDFNGV